MTRTSLFFVFVALLFFGFSSRVESQAVFLVVQFDTEVIANGGDAPALGGTSIRLAMGENNITAGSCFPYDVSGGGETQRVYGEEGVLFRDMVESSSLLPLRFEIYSTNASIGCVDWNTVTNITDAFNPVSWFMSLPLTWQYVSYSATVGPLTLNFNFRYQFNGLLAPKVEGIFPQGFERPDIKELLPLASVVDPNSLNIHPSLRHKSIFIAGPQVDGGSDAVTLSCVFYIEEPASSTATATGSELSLTGTNNKKFREFTSTGAVRRDATYFSTIKQMWPTTEVYGIPPILSQWPTYLECPEALYTIAKYASVNPNLQSAMWSLGSRIVVKARWDINSKITESEEFPTFLIHGVWDRANVSIPASLPMSTESQIVIQAEYANTQSSNSPPLSYDDGSPELTLSFRKQASDEFYVAWERGAVSNPTLGINAFPLTNNWDGTYSMDFSIDFPGTYCVNILRYDSSSGEMVSVLTDRQCKNIDVSGPGISVSNAEPEDSAFDVKWANQISANQTQYFDPGLNKYLGGNKGSAVSMASLGPLFQRWGGGWFQQRESISMAFEWPMVDADKYLPASAHDWDDDTIFRTLTVYQIIDQGQGEAQYCNQHVDNPAGGELSYYVYPWQHPGSWRGTAVKTVSIPREMENVCATDLIVNVFLRPKAITTGTVPLYNIYLQHDGKRIDLSNTNLNVIFSGEAAPSCCEAVWCGTALEASPVTFDKFKTAWVDTPDDLEGYDCDLTYQNQPGFNWATTPASGWQATTGCTFTCTNGTGAVFQCDAGDSEFSCQFPREECCETDFCNVAWTDYKATFGPKGSPWDDGKFECQYNAANWPSSWSGADINWKNDSSIGAQCTFECLQSADSGWRRTCSVDHDTCKFALPGNSTTPSFGPNCASFPAVITNPSITQKFCFGPENVPELSEFLAGSLSGEWQLGLEVFDPDGIGAFIDWNLEFKTQSCYALPGIPTIRCAKGRGTSADEEGTDVVLTCPPGTVITEIQQVLYGQPQGDCASNYTNPGGCTFDAATNAPELMEWIKRKCLGTDICTLSADPALVGPPDYDYSCPQVRCNARSSQLCDPPPSYLNIKARCDLSSAAYYIKEEQPPTATPEPQLYVTTVSANLDGDTRIDVFSVYARHGGCLNVAIKTIVGPSFGGGTIEQHTWEWCHTNVSGSSQPMNVYSPIKLVAGDFDEDGYDEVVIAYVDQSGNLRTWLWDLEANLKQPECEQEPAGPNCVWLGGSFTSDQWDYVPALRRSFDFAKPLYFCRACDPGRIIPNADSIGSSFAIAAGDIDYNMNSELVIAWIDPFGQLSVQVFDYDYVAVGDSFVRTMVGQPAPPFLKLGEYNHPRAVSLAIGNWLGKGYSSVEVIVWDDDGISVHHLTSDWLRDFRLSGINRVTLDRVSAPANNFNLRTAVGDVNADDDHELVIAYSTLTDAHILVLDIDSTQESMGLLYKTRTSFPLAPSSSVRSAELLVDIGNIDDSRAEEIVVAAEYRTSQVTATDAPTRVQLMGFACASAECTSLRALGTHCYHGPGYVTTSGTTTEEQQSAYIPNNIGMTVGNFYGRGLRVLLPEYWRFEGIPALLAVINAPPTHLDYFDGKPVIVNAATVAGKSPSYASNRNNQGLVSQWDLINDSGTVTTKIDATAVDLSVMVAFFHFDWQKLVMDSSLTSRGTSGVGKVALSKAIIAAQDDIVVYILNTYDIWRYPMVDWTGAVIGTMEIRIPSSCGEDCITQTSGRQLRWYRPDHQVFNILSYPFTAPADFRTANRIFVGDRLLVGLNPNEIYLDSSFDTSQIIASTDDDHTQTQWNINTALGTTLGWEANITPFGVGTTLKFQLMIKAGYQHQEASRTQTTIKQSKQVTFTKVATIHVAFEGILPKFSYWVQPFAYYSVDPNGNKYYKVDYSVEPFFEPGLVQWWQEVYNKPDPTFNLPWAFANLHKSMTMYTKEMTYSPNPPVVGQAITVKFTIRNYSPIEARGVEVRYWRGDPHNCGVDYTCIMDALISSVPAITIPKQGKMEVERIWLFDGVQNIYATIDDLELVDEVHEDNNIAYGMIYTTVNPELTRAELNALEVGTGIGYLLRTMQLSAAVDIDNVFLPLFIEGHHLPHAYDISVIVTGDSFYRRNVVVAYYLGDPTTNSVTAKAIANILVSDMNAQNTTTVTATWDVTEIHGPQTINVFILHSGPSVSANNIVSRLTLEKNVGCFKGLDPCGICGGDGTTCLGCDGVANSGLRLDGCGVCGGDGSSCCIRKDEWTIPLQLSDTPNVLSIKVGDTVFWENHHSEPHRLVGVGGDDKQVFLQRSFVVDPDPNYAKGYDLKRVQREAPPEVKPLRKFFSGQAKRKRAEHDFSNKQLLRPAFTLWSSDPVPKLTSVEQYRFMHHDVAKRKTYISSRVLNSGFSVLQDYNQQNNELLKSIHTALTTPAPKKPLSVTLGLTSGISVASTIGTAPTGTVTNRVTANSFGGLGAQGLGGYTDVSQILHSNTEDTSAYIQPGGGSYGIAFNLPGVYQWISSKFPAIRGSIYVTFSKPPLKMDACGVCGGDNSSCVDCAGVPFGTAVLDQCHICSGGTTGVEPGSTLDCAGVCSGSATYDECGWCTGGSTGIEPGASRDCFGNCSGPGKLVCGQCFNFTNFLPGVDFSIALGLPYELLPFDCFGTCKRNYSNATQMAYLNECGICVDGESGVDANAGKDCFGSCFGQARYDRCGVCYGGNTSRLQTPFGDPCPQIVESVLAPRRQTQDFSNTLVPGVPCLFNEEGAAFFPDCAGECNGTAIINECNQCVLGSTGRDINYGRDCAGSCGGSAALDDCGVCSGGSTKILPNLLKDCTGLCNGTAFYDDCGTCSGGTTEHEANSGKDCAGTCNGTAVYDDCGVCTLGTSGREYNKNKDCAGQCFGSHTPDSLSCNCPTYLDGCFVCGGDNTSCAGCDGIPFSGLEFDYCGVCDGDNTGCCYSDECGAHTTLVEYIATPAKVRVVTGEPVYFHNEDVQNKYTIVLTDAAGIQDSRTLVVPRGNIEAVSFPHPSTWLFTALEFQILQGSIEVTDYNRNKTVDGLCQRSRVIPTSSSSTDNSGGDLNSGSLRSSFLVDMLNWFVRVLF